MRRRILPFTVCVTTIVIAGTVLWVHAGSLTPPAGPVAPTMKTLDQISNQIAAIPAGSIKRIIRGTLYFDKNAPDPSVASSSDPFSPAIDPARSIVFLSDAVITDFTTSSSGDTQRARTGACVESLTATQITVRIDNLHLNVKVSYQIVEYN